MRRGVLFLCFYFLAITVCEGQEGNVEVLKKYHDNGKLFIETTMKGGKKNGVEKMYYDNGNIMFVQYFKQDMIVDSFFQYSKDSLNKLEVYGYITPISRFTAIDYPSKRVVGITDYKEKMIGEGLVKVFYSNGQTQSLSEYHNGKRKGPYMIYHSNGNVKIIKHYKDGIEVSPKIEFDSTGKLLEHKKIE